ncbi:UDP-N-acetylmuramoyl-tripeptide--D-alanyl-D-alanine ligase [Palleronia marisminoris]|uniref:UDP-N-acetylmuramoyl-tripeptide--D-alanyl-D-alanine ligase n=1 Tax=Palleronia marisminoris TaxID=315423 RepID=A0A1Y5RR44_9RHOB|nr:UDP-N-acetylmuramoyl-tripeptide--D-alanyl-D-alanine ligase [Palleronia marisminoris]SFG53790.1 UDP-N-acetylmuramoyl-tripeptide--D-alanyl-D-alanine ligase [Palleronia marisminoris]SLN23381.1 UDP-N-acetylmuramoyl-tripeptide--D-alanyl-D-alanine ligase [Palleronia marisminoris]
MSLWTSADAARATGGCATTEWAADGVSIDTRTLAPGDLFVALTAARDGHEFVAQALAKGAAAALVSRLPEGVSEDAPLLIVDDVQTALEGLGRFARDRLQGRVLAITGSVGKTTTKEMARVAFSGQRRTEAAVASYNNHWGVPLTLARTPPETELLIVEIGMSHAGEIAPLSRLARPHVAIVTTVAAAHLEAFGNLEGIAAEKASIFEGLESGGVAIYNADLPTTPILTAAAGDSGMTFGLTDSADLHIRDVTLADEATIVRANHEDYDILYRISAPGRHLALNAASIILAAKPLGADPDVTAQAISAWQPPAGRGARETVTLDAVEGRSLTLIDDAFNANPASMAAALDRIAAAEPEKGGRRIAILTDMLELGPEARSLHKSLADHSGMNRLAQVHTAGPLMRALHEALPSDRRGHWAETAEELAAEIATLVHSGDIVLVKGSKSSKAALLVDAIRELGHRDRRPAAEAR